ncbi:MAG: DUF368 domain-containing protein [Bacilli bacterium]|nr:DUF368 domain-containing protein [Bacilli bacterium]
MKFKEILKNFLGGFGIGVGAAIPGVSGGTIAVILKVYEKIIESVSGIFRHFVKSIKVLIPVLIGVVIALIPMMILMDNALNNFVFGIVCVFAGFILGSFPSVLDEVKGQSVQKKDIIFLIIAFIIALGLGLLSLFLGEKADVSSQFANPQPWFYIVMIPVGVLASSALVIPGISGGMILLLIGFYKPLVQDTVTIMKECLHGDWSRFGPIAGLLVCFVVGVLLGFFLISKIMNILFKKYHKTTFYGIIGFISGSFIALFFNNEIGQYYKLWMSGGQGALSMQVEIILGVVLFVIATVLGYLLVRLQRKQD